MIKRLRNTALEARFQVEDGFGQFFPHKIFLTVQFIRINLLFI